MRVLVGTSLFVLGLMTAASSSAAVPMSATLAAPVAKSKTIVAGGGVWRCAETTCRLSSENTVDSMQACRQIVKQLGEVTALGAEGKELSPERLATCNARR